MLLFLQAIPFRYKSHRSREVWTTCKIIFPSTSNIGMFIIQSSLLLSPSWQAHSFVLWNSSPLYKGTFSAQCTINFAISPKRYFMNTNYIFDKILTIYSAKFYSLLILDFSREEDVFGIIWSFFITFLEIQFQMCIESGSCVLRFYFLPLDLFAKYNSQLQWKNSWFCIR